MNLGAYKRYCEFGDKESIKQQEEPRVREFRKFGTASLQGITVLSFFEILYVEKLAKNVQKRPGNLEVHSLSINPYSKFHDLLTLWLISIICLFVCLCRPQKLQIDIATPSDGLSLFRDSTSSPRTILLNFFTTLML